MLQHFSQNTIYARRNTKLMLEMSFAGKDHRDSVVVRCGDDFIIFFRAARLRYCSYACPGGVFNVVREREERIRGHDTTVRLVAGVLKSNQAGLNAIHLTCPYA